MFALTWPEVKDLGSKGQVETKRAPASKGIYCCLLILPALHLPFEGFTFVLGNSAMTATAAVWNECVHNYKNTTMSGNAPWPQLWCWEYHTNNALIPVLLSAVWLTAWCEVSEPSHPFIHPHLHLPQNVQGLWKWYSLLACGTKYILISTTLIIGTFLRGYWHMA